MAMIIALKIATTKHPKLLERYIGMLKQSTAEWANVYRAETDGRRCEPD
jgi:hypothetical protein